MSAIGLKLQGQFKFDVYDSKGNLKKSSEFIDNFITNSGVLYPYNFAFADCFRFLSVGLGDAPNSVIATAPGIETTGLEMPDIVYSYIGGRPAFTSTVDETRYSKSPSCGFTEGNGSIGLIRQWTLPDNIGGTFQEAHTFKEFMVSPGRPYVKGTAGEQLCTCNDIDAENVTYGLDCSATAEYYSWVAKLYQGIEKKLKICDATAAFARIVPPQIDVVKDDILNVTYKLNITFDTGIKFKSMYYNNISSPDNWSQYLALISNVTNPGIKLINNGQIVNSYAPNGIQRLQHFDYGVDGRNYDFGYEYGESFVPPFGAPLEPSCINAGNDGQYWNNVFYLSDDNIEFLVNPSGGELKHPENYSPWNGEATPIVKISNSGLLPFTNENSNALLRGQEYWSANFNAYNIRTDKGMRPDPTDITLSETMTSTQSYRSAFRSRPVSGFTRMVNKGIRTGFVSYSFNFQNFPNTQQLFAKSLVAAYQDIPWGANRFGGDYTNPVPFFDVIFSGIAPDKVFIPTMTTEIIDIPIPGTVREYINGADSESYFYLLNDGASIYPIFNTKLIWSVPCPGGADGCT